MRKFIRILFFLLHSKFIKLKFWDIYYKLLSNKLDYNFKISYIIPTNTNPSSLWDRTIPSILNQINVQKEIIIVLDSCSENLTEKFESITNNIRRYPEADIKLIQSSEYKVPVISFFGNKDISTNPRWLSAGTIPFIDGIKIAKYEWITLFAHDDRLPDRSTSFHMFEELMSNRKLVILGVIKQISPDNLQNKSFTNNPATKNNYGIQGSIFHKNIVKYLLNLQDVRIGFANDWGVIKRLKISKIKLVQTNTVMAEYFPSSLWSLHQTTHDMPQNP